MKMKPKSDNGQLQWFVRRTLWYIYAMHTIQLDSPSRHQPNDRLPTTMSTHRHIHLYVMCQLHPLRAIFRFFFSFSFTWNGIQCVSVHKRAKKILELHRENQQPASNCALYAFLLWSAQTVEFKVWTPFEVHI